MTGVGATLTEEESHFLQATLLDSEAAGRTDTQEPHEPGREEGARHDTPMASSSPAPSPHPAPSQRSVGSRARTAASQQQRSPAANNDVFRRVRELEAQLEQWQQEGSDQLPDTAEKLCREYNDVAMLLMDAGNKEAAFELLQKAQVLSEPNGAIATHGNTAAQQRLHAVTLNNMGCYYKGRGKLQAALHYLTQASDVERAAQQQQQQQQAGEGSGSSGKGGAVENPAGTLLNMCAVLCSLGRHEQALASAEEALLCLYASAGVEEAEVQVYAEGAATGDDPGHTELLITGPPAAAPSPESQAALRQMKPAQASMLAMAFYNRAVALEHLELHERALASYSTATQLAVRQFGRASNLSLMFVKSHQAFKLKARELQKRSNGKASKAQRQPGPQPQPQQQQQQQRRRQSSGSGSQLYGSDGSAQAAASPAAGPPAGGAGTRPAASEASEEGDQGASSSSGPGLHLSSMLAPSSSPTRGSGRPNRHAGASSSRAQVRGGAAYAAGSAQGGAVGSSGKPPSGGSSGKPPSSGRSGARGGGGSKSTSLPQLASPGLPPSQLPPIPSRRSHSRRASSASGGSDGPDGGEGASARPAPLPSSQGQAAAASRSPAPSSLPRRARSSSPSPMPPAPLSDLGTSLRGGGSDGASVAGLSEGGASLEAMMRQRRAMLGSMKKTGRPVLPALRDGVARLGV